MGADIISISFLHSPAGRFGLGELCVFLFLVDICSHRYNPSVAVYTLKLIRLSCCIFILCCNDFPLSDTSTSFRAFLYPLAWEIYLFQENYKFDFMHFCFLFLYFINVYLHFKKGVCSLHRLGCITVCFQVTLLFDGMRLFAYCLLAVYFSLSLRSSVTVRYSISWTSEVHLFS